MFSNEEEKEEKEKNVEYIPSVVSASFPQQTPHPGAVSPTPTERVYSLRFNDGVRISFAEHPYDDVRAEVDEWKRIKIEGMQRLSELKEAIQDGSETKVLELLINIIERMNDISQRYQQATRGQRPYTKIILEQIRQINYELTVAIILLLRKGYSMSDIDKKFSLKVCLIENLDTTNKNMILETYQRMLIAKRFAALKSSENSEPTVSPAPSSSSRSSESSEFTASQMEYFLYCQNEILNLIQQNASADFIKSLGFTAEFIRNMPYQCRSVIARALTNKGFSRGSRGSLLAATNGYLDFYDEIEEPVGDSSDYSSDYSSDDSLLSEIKRRLRDEK